ncbi:MAG: tol-pal system-associated acyl-CoA thioesterase [Mariprofundaceae bacterium]
MNWSHTWPVRVYYEDTDHIGMVYYANYLKFMERARTEMLRSTGIELDELELQEGVSFTVTSVLIKYHQPARFNDLLEVKSNIEEAKGARINFHQYIWKCGALLVRAKIGVACMNRQGKPVRIPGTVITQMQKQEQ